MRLIRSRLPFFGYVQHVLLDEVQLTLSRLADPARTGGRENLNLATLIEGIERLGLEPLAAELGAHLKAYRDACHAIIERRHHRMAHYDLQTHLAADRESLKGSSRAEVEGALERLRVFMRAVFGHFENSYMAYEHFWMFDDAEGLVRGVSEALRYRELQEKGQISDPDLMQSKICQDLEPPARSSAL